MSKVKKTTGTAAGRGAKRSATSMARGPATGRASASGRPAVTKRSAASPRATPQPRASLPVREAPTSRGAVTRTRVSEVKKPKSYRLSEAKIERARKILGAPTATAAIEEALDMVVFRSELLRSAAALRGMRFAQVDEDAESGAAEPKGSAGG